MKEEEVGKIRIKDIADLAGVSAGTVDRVIHQRSGVSPKSKLKVEEVLKKINYQPNKYASALASNKKYRIACLLPKHEKGEYWTFIENGIQSGINEYSDFNLAVDYFYYNPFEAKEFSERATQIQCENYQGVILAPTKKEYTIPFAKELNEKEIPFIYLDSEVEEEPALSFIGQNSIASGEFCARIALLANKENSPIVIVKFSDKGEVGSNQQMLREKGFKAYLTKNNISLPIIEIEANKKTIEQKELSNVLDKHQKINTIITFSSKGYLIGESLKNNQKQDINLIGYDLLERNIKGLKDGFISFVIAQQPEYQGYKSIQTLSNKLIFKKEVPKKQFMPIDLITKETIDYYIKID